MLPPSGQIVQKIFSYSSKRKKDVIVITITFVLHIIANEHFTVYYLIQCLQDPYEVGITHIRQKTD